MSDRGSDTVRDAPASATRRRRVGNGPYQAVSSASERPGATEYRPGRGSDRPVPVRESGGGGTVGRVTVVIPDSLEAVPEAWRRCGEWGGRRSGRLSPGRSGVPVVADRVSSCC
ncbi:hypothetical protein GCM10022232_07560 [Streptomyces plumbiresistens]|uniref:Uncharacterized protein n=1 Tax=Streptomyces plumbiresistens TaxID=511811 RepID=A0ABP7Q914_9ACTN